MSRLSAEPLSPFCFGRVRFTGSSYSENGMGSARRLPHLKTGQAALSPRIVMRKRSWFENTCIAMDRQPPICLQAGWAVPANRRGVCGTPFQKKWRLSQSSKKRHLSCQRTGNASLLRPLLPGITRKICRGISCCSEGTILTWTSVTVRSFNPIKHFRNRSGSL